LRAGVSHVHDYEYELRRGTIVVATGRIQLERPPSPGESISLGARWARVEDVLHLSGRRRLILEQR
jgi:hypothetical protein